MGEAKPWQIILIVVAICVVGYSAWRVIGGSGSEMNQLASSVVMVDVETGELFEFDIRGRRGILIPGERPDNGRMSLLPTYQENGQWFISQRDLSALEYSDIELRVVDRSTGAVNVDNPEQITRVRN